MTNDRKLEILWDERGITKVILSFGRALDTVDMPLYRKCLTDPVKLNFERLTGFPEIWASHSKLIPWVLAFFNPLRTHHTYTNLRIEVEGDSAYALVYMTARHWKTTDQGSSLNTQYGWYEFGLQRMGENWQINRIKHDFQWVDGNAGLFDQTEPQMIAAVQDLFGAENIARATTGSVGKPSVNRTSGPTH